jgi:single-strand DNA-binding protein
MNKLEVIGNVGRDPEMRYTPSGQAVTSFSLASNRKYKSSTGEDVKETVWVKCSAWGKIAETLNQYVHKGDKLYVSGQLVADKVTGGPRIWQRKEDGSSAASFEITVREFEFLTSKGEGGPGDPTDEDALAAGVKIPGAAVSPVDTASPSEPAVITEEEAPF